MSKVDEKLKKLEEKYGIYTREEFYQAYREMNRMNVGIFVTAFGKEIHETKDLRSVISGYTYRGHRRKRGGEECGSDSGGDGTDGRVDGDHGGPGINDHGELQAAGA
jgi:hypothetical protein